VTRHYKRMLSDKVPAKDSVKSLFRVVRRSSILIIEFLFKAKTHL
jgi:hypothetical protein